MRTCADCGVKVELKRGRWGALVPGIGGRKAWSFVCRMKVEDDRCIAADYHYVEGEEQRHFPEVNQ